MKKLFCLFVVLICLSAGFYLYLEKSAQRVSVPGYCPFCDPLVLNRQKFYEDDLVLALYTYKPVLPGHSLVLPKRHVARFEELTDAEIERMGQVIKKVNLAAQQVFQIYPYLLLQKNGGEVGQSVLHVHFHYIPRKAGDSSEMKLLLQMKLADLRKPISAEEMQKNVMQMKRALEHEKSHAN